jgi:hypothetical protein
MQWPKDKREKLAIVIRARSQEILQETLERFVNDPFDKRLEAFDEKIIEFLRPLGFRVAKRWEVESHEGIVLFKQSQTHLFFGLSQGMVVGIRKDHAEKILVLGLPG